MRILLFTGKGGVGKTTTAAATALACAERGLRTLAVSTDPAHSLADAFDLPLGSTPAVIDGLLWGQQLDATERLEEQWGAIRDYLVEVFDWAGIEAIEAEELAVVPGLDEIFSLADIADVARSGAWDVLVVDCAPTAETLRLLSLPDVAAWYMDRVFPATRRMNRVVGPVLRRVSNLPIAGDEVFGAGLRFYDRLDEARRLLGDPERASVRLVVNPERMVVAEARRTFTYLSLFGYSVDAVVANRLLPEAVTDPWFDRWRAVQGEHLDAIESGFAPLPVLRVELADTEIVGLDRLRVLAEVLYRHHPPEAVLHRGRPFTVERIDDGWVMGIELPFAGHDDLELGRKRDELLIRVGPYRRQVTLPDSLRRRSVASASLRDGVLRVHFGSEPHATDGDGASGPEGAAAPPQPG